MRLFVALELPVAVRARLAAWTARAAPPQVRAVAEQSLHVTLAFLGTRDTADAAAVGGLLEGLARPLGLLRDAGGLWLPPRRPRVLTVALAVDDAVTELRVQLVRSLQAAIGFEPEPRAFAPHVTVGRVAPGARIDVRRALDPPAPELCFHAQALTLYRSHTAPGGARYEVLARVALT